MKHLLQLFREHWTTRYALPGRGTSLLAVSGGSDSMVMADLFRCSGFPFAIAHCNFGLRAEASDLDEQLVRDWCIRYDIPFHTTRFDTKKRSQEWKKGTQETARILRYEWFEQVRAENSYACIATAHHAGDNVETLFINLFKGTGMAGLHGIPAQKGSVVRPLLFATKDLIAAYAAQNNVPYRNDASNDTDDYLRNAVRHNIVPAVQQWFPNAIASINDSITRFAEAELLYRRAVEQERKKLIEQRGQDHYIPIRKLRLRQPLATICYELIVPFGFNSAQVPHVLDLLHAESGHFISSSTHRIIRNRDFLIITTLPADTADLIVIDAAPCIIHTGKYRFSFSIIDKLASIPAGKEAAYLDMKMIQFPLLLRKWRMGDYLYPFGMNMKKKKVSRLLIDEKVPLHEKEEVRILECSKRVAWVSGIRPDERFRVHDGTEKVLLVQREKL